jgi:biopolymer transport protein ExbD
MAEHHAGAEQVGEAQGPVLRRRPIDQSAEMDITPMIDCTFLLLIFFLVASRPDIKTAVDLPPARFGKGVSDRTTVIITVAAVGEGRSQVYFADGALAGALVTDDPNNPAALEHQITQYVQDGLEQGKSSVLVKADKRVLHRDVNRVAQAAGAAEGVGQLHFAVFEIE